MNLIFARHCEIEVGNQYKSNFPLSQLGLRQAVELAAELKERYPDVQRIFSSPLYRAVETACYLARAYQMPFEIMPDLQDIGMLLNFDDVRPLALRSLGRIMGQADDHPEYGWQTAIIVTHGFPIQVMFSYLSGVAEQTVNCNRGRYLVYSR